MGLQRRGRRVFAAAIMECSQRRGSADSRSGKMHLGQSSDAGNWQQLSSHGCCHRHVGSEHRQWRSVSASVSWSHVRIPAFRSWTSAVALGPSSARRYRSVSTLRKILFGQECKELCRFLVLEVTIGSGYGLAMHLCNDPNRLVAASDVGMPDDGGLRYLTLRDVRRERARCPLAAIRAWNLVARSHTYR